MFADMVAEWESTLITELKAKTAELRARIEREGEDRDFVDEQRLATLERVLERLTISQQAAKFQIR